MNQFEIRTAINSIRGGFNDFGLNGDVFTVETMDGVEWPADRTDKPTWAEITTALSQISAVVATESARRRASKLVQKRLDTEARKRGYDNIHTACGWSGQFTDADALKTWGAACWKKAGAIEAAAKQGQKYNLAWASVIPTETEFLSELPVLVLP